MTTKRFFIAMLLCILLLSCRNFTLTHKEQSFKEMFPEESLNQNMRLWIGEGKEKLKVGEPFTLLIDNKTKNQIHFLVDKDIHILTYDDNKKIWNEINNNAKYSSTKVIIPPVGPDSPGTNEVTILPDIKMSDQEVKIRIVVMGYLNSDNSQTEETSTSFIDVTLKP